MPDQRSIKKEPSSTGSAGLSDSCFSENVCSSTDCTGLIPALPSSEAELESYEEMYRFCAAPPSAKEEEPAE